MRVKTFIAAVVLGSIAGAAPATADLDERRAQCVAWMMNGYPSGIEEVACKAQFSLPSPFLFNCVRAQRLGFDTDTHRRACHVFFVQAAEATERGYIRN